MSRNRFVKSVGVATAAVSGLLPLGSHLALADPAGASQRKLSCNLMGFQACLDGTFRIRGGSAVLRMKLVGVTNLIAGQAADGASGRECFLLVFRGQRASSLTQNTYRFEHARLGTFPLFIVPYGSEKERGSTKPSSIGSTQPLCWHG